MSGEIGPTDWRNGKWNLVATSVDEALSDVDACTKDLQTALMVLSSHKNGLMNVSGALDKLVLYQRILVNTLKAQGAEK